jgi:3-methyladenine DNA glycosylase AlkD
MPSVLGTKRVREQVSSISVGQSQEKGFFMNAKTIRQRLSEVASPEVALASSRYFKTGLGEYGEGDRFIGIRVPVLRKFAHAFRELPLSEVSLLLKTGPHEERHLALLILVKQADRASEELRKELLEFYLSHTPWVNNWDLVDVSAPPLVGSYLLVAEKGERKMLTRLSKSENLWERRIAVIATLTLIRDLQFEDTLRLCRLLLQDPHDLMHKACGWMLREVGNRDASVLTIFLDEHALRMPRTMLRYAIERLSPTLRQKYMRRS